MRTAVAFVFLLLCACGANDPTPGGSPGGTGGNAGMNAGTGGSSGSAGAGAGAGGGGGNAGAGAGAGAGGSSGAAGGGGTSIGGSSGAAGSGGTPDGGSGGSSGGSGAFVVTSPAFRNVDGCAVDNPSPCEVFPDENVSYMENANVSPELAWTGAPSGTQSFALVLFDVTFGQAHWVVWNIPGDVDMLAANVPKDAAMLTTPAGAQQANANFATEEADGYFGPHLPCNVFEFQLHALSLATFSPMDPESAVLVAIELQELGEALLGVTKLTGRSNDYMTTCQ